MPTPPNRSAVQTATPIKHLVVIFHENNSFDHYFGTYPNASTRAAKRSVRSTRSENPRLFRCPTRLLLMASLPPLVILNAVAPFRRLDRAQALTCDNDNHYNDEQKAYDPAR